MSLPIILYRVQDAAGRGPWRPGMGLLWIDERPDHDNLRPLFEEFPGVLRRHVVGMSLGCGCRTVAQLQRWFTPKEYRRLLGYGYQAVSMEVGRILGESAVQCVFERAKLLRDGATVFDLYDDAEVAKHGS